MVEPSSSAVVEPILLSAVQAAQLCGVSRSHFLGLHVAGKVPLPVRLGRRTLWKTDELKSWVEAGCPPREVWQNTRRSPRSR